jgi:hypothetical protein
LANGQHTAYALRFPGRLPGCARQFPARWAIAKCRRAALDCMPPGLGSRLCCCATCCHKSSTGQAALAQQGGRPSASQALSASLTASASPRMLFHMLIHVMQCCGHCTSSSTGHSASKCSVPSWHCQAAAGNLYVAPGLGTYQMHASDAHAWSLIECQGD